ncbi:MAG: beta-agarase [Planctomycetes bacterium B3_Pla]|nr:MAG: beta-agarase [Planctomycetes bacterium B3_Pla]
MKKGTRRISLTLFHIWIFLNMVLISSAAPAGGETLFDFEPPFDVNTAITQDAKAELVEREGNTLLRINMGHAERWPGVTLKAPKGKWDLTNHRAVALDVKNIGNKAVTVSCRVDNPGANGYSENCIMDWVYLKPEESKTLKVFLCVTPWRFTKPLKLIGMRESPDISDKIDPSGVTQLILSVPENYDYLPKTDHAIEVDNIRAEGELKTMDAEAFFPFIDKFGQFIHADWPGKTRDEKDLKERAKTEKKDLENHPGPRGWNRYGGWKNGPRFKATGFFRAEKHKGKWWLIDPEGRLFWSLGIDCVRFDAFDADTRWSNGTALTDREHYFKDLPKRDSPLGRFYVKSSQVPSGYYKGKGTFETFTFSESNLLRKYGKDYEASYMELVHRRLRSWGQNTIGNWSDGRTKALRKTPYVATFDLISSRKIEGSGSKHLWKFPDPFSPDFRTDLRERLERERAGLSSWSFRLGKHVHNEELGGIASDPWCLGIFVDNEMGWGDDISLALASLASPPDQPAKIAFLEDLKTRYKEIRNLNDAWGTDHASWNDLLRATETPDEKKAGPDLRDFYTRIAEEYFRVCRGEVRRASPNHLYLGCRFQGSNDRAVRAAAKYCDVLSYNPYCYDVSEYRPPSGVDMPVIIGEFQFGAIDRGMFSSDLVETENQEDRAEKYKSYVQGALRNPFYVGAHWFQYYDEAATGRPDGENNQTGFVDVCDTPYDETVQAAREVGDILYEYRLKN